jgi:hypothetical protein
MHDLSQGDRDVGPGQCGLPRISLPDTWVNKISPSLFIRDSTLFATLPATWRWVEEVAGLADDREIRELLRGVFGRRAVRVVGVVALLVVVVVLLFLVLNWYVAPTKPSGRKDLILAAAQILGGVALLSGLYFTWCTLQVNREGQITERIAKESEEDYEPIMEILTAYVRQDAALKSGKETAEEVLDEQERTVDPDIEAILSALRRLTRFYDRGKPKPLDLHETNLTRANLTKANLSGANLIGADLYDGADLTGADLSEADFRSANLRRASLAEANLKGANLAYADLSKAVLYRANLSGAFIQQTNLSEARLLNQRQLESAVGSKRTTRLPSKLKLPAHWDPH